MATGMMLAVLAFIAATVVELNVSKDLLKTPLPRESLLQVLNLADGVVMVNISGTGLFPNPITSYADPKGYQILYLNGVEQSLETLVMLHNQSVEWPLTFHEQKAYSLILHNGDSGIQCKFVEDITGYSDNGEPYLRFVNTMPESVNFTVDGEDFWVPGSYGVSHVKSVERGEYKGVKYKLGQEEYLADLGLLDFGASYTIIVNKSPDGIVTNKMEDVRANNVHIAWQIPQYILMTAGQVIFGVTGLDFSYSQAPANMKSVLQAGWFLTMGFGNLVVLIIVQGTRLQEWVEFLFFAGLQLAACIIFSIMAYFYTYVKPEDMRGAFQDSDGRGFHEEDEYIMKVKEIETLNVNTVIRTTKM